MRLTTPKGNVYDLGENPTQADVDAAIAKDRTSADTRPYVDKKPSIPKAPKQAVPKIAVGMAAGASVGKSHGFKLQDEEDPSETNRRYLAHKGADAQKQAFEGLHKIAKRAGEGAENMRYNVLSSLKIPTSPPDYNSVLSRTVEAGANVPVDAVEHPVETALTALVSHGIGMGATKGVGALAKSLGKGAKAAGPAAELKVVTGGKYGKLKDELNDIVASGRKAGPPPEPVVNSTGQRITNSSTLTKDLEASLLTVKPKVPKNVPKIAAQDPWDLYQEAVTKQNAGRATRSKQMGGRIRLKGEVPVTGEMVKEAQQKGGKFAGFMYKGLTGVSRTMQTIGDLSATFKQGGYLTGKKGSVDAIKKSIKSIVDEDVMDAIEMRAIEGPNAHIYKRGKLFLSVKGEEEPFLESFAHKLNIPKKLTGGRTIGVKPVIDASERQYNSLLNLQRMNAMDEFAARYPKATDDELVQYGRSLNNATGRGNVDYKALNGIFYSPRFMASRFGTVGDISKALGQTVSGNANAASKEILKDASRFVASRGAVLLIGAQTGAWEIETDPKSSDWMKVKVGGRVFDPWAGYLGPARFMVQALQKDKRAANNLAGTYLGNKSAPNVNLFYELKDRKGFDGKKTTPLESVGRAVTPLNIQGLLQAWKETNGDAGESLAAFAADTTGIGTGKSRGKGGKSGPSFPKMPTFKPPKMGH